MIYNKVIPIKPDGAKRFCIISDVHLGHRNTATAHIVDNLLHYVVNPLMFSQIEALFITGDLFDRLLNLSMTNTGPINQFVSKMLRMAKVHDVAIRVLEGTPKHDWKQSKIFLEVNEAHEVGADVKHYTELTVEKDEKLGLVIGYIPDEYRDTASETENELREMMATRGYDKLHFLMMHGCFDFQLPVESVNNFDSSSMEELVIHNIYIGHDHNAKSKGKIIIPSSFDRTSHSETGPRGFVIVDLINGITINHRIENERALPYITLDYTDKTDEQILDELRTILATATTGYLKLRLSADSALRSVANKWQQQTTADLEIEWITNKIDEETLISDFEMTKVYSTPSPDNIAMLIEKELLETERSFDAELVSAEIRYIQEQL